MELLGPYCFQGYEVYVDNFYSSPVLFDNLFKVGIAATGTFGTNRKEIPMFYHPKTRRFAAS